MIRVSAFQAIPKPTFNERKDQIFETLEFADQNNIDFLCFPEGFLTGYYSEYELALENSLNVKENDFKTWLSQISSFKTSIIIGFNEKEDNHIYNSAAIIENGKLIGIQRKHYLYHNYFTPSNSFRVFKSKGIIFGVVICIDSNYFEPSRILALQGASILFVPICNKVPLDHQFVQKPPYYSHIIARSHENRCWIIGADWVWPNDGKTICTGHSFIYDPDGKEMKRSLEGKQQFLIHDIQRNRLLIEKGRRVYGSSILAKEIEKLSK